MKSLFFILIFSLALASSYGDEGGFKPFVKTFRSTESRESRPRAAAKDHFEADPNGWAPKGRPVVDSNYIIPIEKPKHPLGESLVMPKDYRGWRW